LFKYLILDCTFPYLPAAFAINRTAFNDFNALYLALLISV